MGYRVGVDIGGSFTDFALFDEDAVALAGELDPGDHLRPRLVGAGEHLEAAQALRTR
jgi:N-methylhydantoinase A/oxoprolinase/acetone carboxylase beta subunit